VSVLTALTVFALILPAELPDKTMVATLVLSTRFRPWPVWVGVVAGFAVQCAIAVAAGGLVSLLPSVVVHAVTAAMFAVGALLLLRGNARDAAADEEAELNAELRQTPSVPSYRRVALTSFAVLFAAEWGDLTQILTANLAAKYGDPLAVFIGSFVALTVVATVGVIGGRTLIRVVPLDVVRRLAALLFTAMAVVTAIEAARA
jgi:putative Ca2+/H+ antiporter (TMEM165/GDT1 family)